MENKQLDFTIANPYILDEQYSGSTPAKTSGITPGPPPKETPFVPVIAVLAVMLMIWLWRRG